jgi:hypothetical protein
MALEIPSINIESTKLTETSLDASQTVDVLDEDKLNTFQADSIEDLSSVLSNTIISGLGNRSDKTFTIRGISNYLTYESSVAMYIDDTPVPSQKPLHVGKPMQSSQKHWPFVPYHF